MGEMKIYCCGCGDHTTAKLVSGKEIYPKRKDLWSLPFWKCPTCRNYVGCHHKTKNPTAPLGCIPTPAIRAARQHIHAILDPIWKEKKMSRKALYALVSERMDDGRQYHTSKIRSIEEARKAYKVIRGIAWEIEVRGAGMIPIGPKNLAIMKEVMKETTCG